MKPFPPFGALSAGYALRINVKATPEQERIADAVNRHCEREMRREWQMRERLAVLGCSEIITSIDPGERYVPCEGCGSKVTTAGRFDDGVLCLPCAEPEVCR